MICQDRLVTDRTKLADEQHHDDGEGALVVRTHLEASEGDILCSVDPDDRVEERRHHLRAHCPRHLYPCYWCWCWRCCASGSISRRRGGGGCSGGSVGPVVQLAFRLVVVPLARAVQEGEV